MRNSREIISYKSYNDECQKIIFINQVLTFNNVILIISQIVSFNVYFSIKFGAKFKAENSCGLGENFLYQN